MKRFKVILIVLACILLSCAVKTAFAYYDDPSQEDAQFETNVWGKPTEYQIDSFSYTNFRKLILGAIKLIGGPNDPEYRKKAGNGAIASVGNLIASLYAYPPASTGIYLADLKESLGLASPAYAQTGGIGFNGLRPILGVWKAFRDISYVFFVLVFIVIGLAIMFRVKIDPRTVISLQNAIPRIVIALILVTFSYAIAGLLIDFIYVVTGIAIAAIKPPSALLYRVDPNMNLLQFNTFFFGEGGKFTSMLTAILNPVGLAGVIAGLPADYVKALKDSFTMGLDKPVELVLYIILFFLFFKTFFALLISYIYILIGIIFAPFKIMLGALPGMDGFGGWLKGLFQHIAVFPAVIILIAIALKILQAMDIGNLWAPPPIQIAGASAHYVAALIGFGMLILISKVPDIIKAAFEKKPFPYGTAIGEAFGPAVMAGRIAAGPAYEQGVKAGIIPPPTTKAGGVISSLYNFGQRQKWWS